MNQYFSVSPSSAANARDAPPISKAALARLLEYTPCLFNQLDRKVTAAGVVHLCELTLGALIDSSNAHQAYLVQHPHKGTPFSFPPVTPATASGTVMELICSEVLQNEGIPRMPLDAEGWPVWQLPGHALMNLGKFSDWKALGDILIPCAPTNLVISVKTESARERLLYSSNSIEGVGFGFFDQPNEFWTESRMTLFKRMGFTAIYMPDNTHHQVMLHLEEHETSVHATNISGRPLYRPLTQFGKDMLRVVGRSSHLL